MHCRTSAIGTEAGIRKGRWKLIHPTRKRGETERYELFLFADLVDARNVAEQHADVVKRLSAKVEALVVTLPNLVSAGFAETRFPASATPGQPKLDTSQD